MPTKVLDWFTWTDSLGKKPVTYGNVTYSFVHGRNIMANDKVATDTLLGKLSGLIILKIIPALRKEGNTIMILHFRFLHGSHINQLLTCNIKQTRLSNIIQEKAVWLEKWNSGYLCTTSSAMVSLDCCWPLWIRLTTSWHVVKCHYVNKDTIHGAYNTLSFDVKTDHDKSWNDSRGVHNFTTSGSIT